MRKNQNICCLGRKGEQSRKRFEAGTFVDQVGSILVMAFCFAILFAFISYAQLVSLRLSINNIAKEYLYKMEQNGYLSATDQAAMTNDLLQLQVQVDANGFDGTDFIQVAYGDSVDLVCSVSFLNPLYRNLGANASRDAYDPSTGNGSLFIQQMNEEDKRIHYVIRMSATSKW